MLCLVQLIQRCITVCLKLEKTKLSINAFNVFLQLFDGQFNACDDRLAQFKLTVPSMEGSDVYVVNQYEFLRNKIKDLYMSYNSMGRLI